MNRRTAPLALALSIAATGTAHAQSVQNLVLRNSFSPTGAGARSLGMGGAFIGVADDGTAASFNPGGLAQLRRSELAFVGFHDRVDTHGTVVGPEGTQTIDDESTHSRPEFLGLAVPFTPGGRSLTVQFSWQRTIDLYGHGVATIADTGSLQQLDPDLADVPVDYVVRVNPEQKGSFQTISMAAGYSATERLSAGLALNYWTAHWEAAGQRDLTVLSSDGVRAVEVPVVSTRFDETQGLHAFSVNLGVLLRYPYLTIGTVLRLPFGGDYTLHEQTTHTEFDPSLPAPHVLAVDFTSPMTIHWPRSAGVGVAVRPFRGLTLAADYTRTQWSRATLDDVPEGALLTGSLNAVDRQAGTQVDRNFFDLLPSSETGTRDTGQWRFGGEYLVNLPKVVVPLRAGGFSDQSPVIDRATDRGRRSTGWTAGLGLNFNRIALDVAYERRHSSASLGLALAGRAAQATSAEETVRQTRIVASVIYRAGGPDDGLARLLHNLFVGPPEDREPGS